MPALPEPWRSLPGEFAKLKKLVSDLSKRSPWSGSGAKVDGKGGIQSDNFDGDLAAGDPGTTGWAMNAWRAAFGELLLRPGSIGNESLTNPVIPKFLYDATSGFGLSPTIAHVRRTTITVPDGVTSAIVSVTARIYAVNDTAGLDYLYCQANVAGYNGNAFPTPASGSNGSGTNVSPFSVLLTGLAPGSTFTVDIDGLTAFGTWSPNAANQADVAGTILWFR